MKTNKQYWQDRFIAVEHMRNRQAKDTVDAVTPAFDSAMREIENQINTWYNRYSINNQISLAEAKRQLSARELKELRWDIGEYIAMGEQNALDPKWMKQLENASARYHISRLEALKIRTQQAAEVAFGNELDELDQMLSQAYTESYYHTAYEIQKGLGIAWDIGQIDQARLTKILKKPWTVDGYTFSNRIWKSKQQLIEAVSTEMTQMCILGGKPDQAIKNLAHKMQVSKSQAGRLIMTESAYFGSKAQQDCFKELDVEKYEIVATLDLHTSEICQAMDGKVFKMSDFEPGVTAPPFHPWCRTVTCPFFDDEFTADETRAARGEDGKTFQIPGSMKYPDWYGCFVDHTMDPADFLKLIKKHDSVKVEKNTFTPDQKLVDQNKYGFNYIEQKHSIQDDLSKVNPNYSKGSLYQNNCGYCSVSYELRRRGYDVEANPKNGLYVTEWANMFKNFTQIKLKAKRKTGIIPEMTDVITKWGEGARGSVFVIWDGRSWGHFYNFEVSGGKVMFIDGQNGKSDVSDYFKRVKPSSVIYGRTDNLEMSDNIAKACKNRGDSK